MERAGSSKELVAVAERFAQWRKRSGGRGTRVPAELWCEAARVARLRGVYATARALRLNYEGLKTRVEGLAAPLAAAGKAGAGFVELQVSPLPVAHGTVIELVGRRGDQLRIHISGGRTTELVALAEAFWSRQS